MGALVGDAVGALVGAAVGALVGAAVGDLVAPALVGDAVGAFVGEPAPGGVTIKRLTEHALGNAWTRLCCQCTYLYQSLRTGLRTLPHGQTSP